MLYIGCHLSSSKGFAAMGRQALELGAGHLSVFHPQSPGKPGQGPGPGGRGGPGGAAGAARLRAHRGPRPLHAEPLRRGGEKPRLRPGDHGGRPAAAGARAGAALQLPPRQPRGPGDGGRHRPASPTASTPFSGRTSPPPCCWKPWPARAARWAAASRSCGPFWTGWSLGEKMGVCLDTCHVSDGGYDIIHDLDGVLTEFDRVIGLERLKAIHLNDSKNPPGSHKDRHACIGEGCHRPGGPDPGRAPPGPAGPALLPGDPQRAARLRPGDRPDAGDRGGVRARLNRSFNRYGRLCYGLSGG